MVTERLTIHACDVPFHLEPGSSQPMRLPLLDDNLASPATCNSLVSGAMGTKPHGCAHCKLKGRGPVSIKAALKDSSVAVYIDQYLPPLLHPITCPEFRCWEIHQVSRPFPDAGCKSSLIISDSITVTHQICY